MKKLLPVFLGLALIFPLYDNVSAQTQRGASDVRPVRAQRLESQDQQPAGRELRQEQIEQRCDVIENRLRVQVARYENNAEKHTARYERMLVRLNSLVSRLQADGTDTAELEAAITVLDEKIQLFAHNAATYVESLRLTQELACGESAGEFVEKLGASRSLLQILRENVLDIKNYWQETLRPLITSLIADAAEQE